MKKLLSLKATLAGCLLFSQLIAVSQIPTTWGNQTIPAGSKIIDMGTTQTIATGVKPFGLVYQLVNTYNVPVLWAINPNKAKDGTDFIQDGVTYKGGPFIIKQGFLSTAVNSLISTWVAKGVVVRTTTTSGSMPIFKEINAAPVWVIDQDNPAIPISFLDDAEIPSTAYSQKNVSLLSICDNLFVMPHADPTWATHNRLFSWVKSIDSTNGCQGWFWGGCHAVSVSENLFNSSLTWQKMNFLSTNGLVPYGSHHDGTPVYINDSFPANPIMQFLSVMDGATTNGSEQIFMPASGSAWRSNVKVGVYDATQQDVPGLSPGKAAVLVFGPAFNDYNSGYVAYEAGHNVSGTKSYNVAAERAFFNFSILAPLMQTRVFNVNSYTIPDTIYTGNTQTLSISVSGNTGPFTYQWSSTCSGAAFSAPTSASTHLTIPPSTGSCIVKVIVTNSCSKVVFGSKAVTLVNVGVLPLQLVKYSITYADNKTKLYWEVATEENGLQYDIERSIDGSNFSSIGSVPIKPEGLIYNYDDPTVNQLHAEVIYYRIRYIGKDGKEKLSPVMVLRMNNNSITRPTIKPNPARNYININLYSGKATSADLALVNVEGATVLRKKISLNSGENSLSISDLNQYPGGMYTVVIKTEKDRVMEKFYILK